MRSGAAILLVGVLLMPGCRSAHDVAESSYQVATAPVTPVRQEPVGATATTTTTTATAASQPPPPSTTAVQQSPTTEATPRVVSSPPPSSTLQFPTAKPVEGKPGFVYSPSDPTKYVDVSGYAPGSKVKDPYSGKIFLVP